MLHREREQERERARERARERDIHTPPHRTATHAQSSERESERDLMSWPRRAAPPHLRAPHPPLCRHHHHARRVTALRFDLARFVVAKPKTRQHDPEHSAPGTRARLRLTSQGLGQGRLIPSTSALASALRLVIPSANGPPTAIPTATATSTVRCHQKRQRRRHEWQR
eukprot:2829131-Rhodomonas_salina.1